MDQIHRASTIYSKQTLIKGKPASVECIDIAGQTYLLKRGPATVVHLEEEWYQDESNPEAVINALRSQLNIGADIYTFWQRPPCIEPKYSYHIEWEDLAVLPIQSYEHWWNQQIKSRVRSQIRKSEKEGLQVRETEFDDNFVRGMATIFNESAVRQGRKFWHYGKDFDTIKREFSRNIEREHMIGAYYQGEMIGFIMLCKAGRFALPGQIISSIKHRDKSTNNVLIAKAVELCVKYQLGDLVYMFWSDDSLAEFKRRCGFQRTPVPRYFIPLTKKGRLALALGAHRGWKGIIPKRLKAQLRKLRTTWNQRNEN